VNDLLDYRLFKSGDFESNKIRFDPKIAIKNVLKIFQEQAR